MSQAELVRRFVEGLTCTSSRTIKPAGEDDVGIIALDQTMWLAATTDYVNFRPHVITLQAGGLSELGFLLVANNVSDLLGSGADPIGVLTSIGLPATATETDVANLIAGIRAASAELGVTILGGDTKQAHVWTLCGTALGLIPAGCAWTQDGARPGHAIALSGAIGAVSAAVLHLTRADGTDELAARCRRALGHPEMPLAVAQQLRALRFAGGGIDLSDGLGGDLHRLLDRSGVGARVEAREIPIHPLARDAAARYGLDPLDLAFGLGGDGQFLVTVPPDRLAEACKAGIHVIGEIISEGRTLSSGAHEFDLPSFGHEDFRSGNSAAEYIHELSRRSRGP